MVGTVIRGRSPGAMKKAASHVYTMTGSLFGQALGRGRIGRKGAFTAVALVATLLFVGFFYVWTRMQLVQIGYEISGLEKKSNALKNRKRELLLEIASLQSPGELEKQARKKAGLVYPAIGKVVHVP